MNSLERCIRNRHGNDFVLFFLPYLPYYFYGLVSWHSCTSKIPHIKRYVSRILCAILSHYCVMWFQLWRILWIKNFEIKKYGILYCEEALGFWRFSTILYSKSLIYWHLNYGFLAILTLTSLSYFLNNVPTFNLHLYSLLKINHTRIYASVSFIRS